MKLFKNLLILFVVLIVFGYGVLFALYNEQSIALDFLFLETITVPLSLWSGGLTVLGVFIGLLVASVSKMLQGVENKRLRKDLQQMKVKFEKLNH